MFNNKRVMKEGFCDQRMVSVSEEISSKLSVDVVRGNLYITDIGFFPHARKHSVLREMGCRQYILIYCIGGVGWVELEGRRRILDKNQYVIIPPDTPHGYGALEGKDWSICWIHYSGTNSNFFSEGIGGVGVVEPSDEARIDDRMKIFEEMLFNLENDFSLESIDYVNILLSYYLSSFKYIDKFRNIKRRNSEDIVSVTISYMKSNIRERIYLDQLAGLVSLSPSYYSSEFKRRTGKTPIDYLTNLRVKEACWLLASTTEQVKDISIKVGFDDPFYFSRVFKNIIGVSPKKYRSNDVSNREEVLIEKYSMFSMC